jgi:uncharacterized protein (TIGR00730 family)
MNICVYCASSTRISEKYNEAASVLGKLMAQNGLNLINGAGSTGLMRICADAVMANGGEATGVIPQFMVDRGWNHEKMSKLIVTPDIHQRKQTMAKLSDGCIALPGGCGTMEELLEIITWKQLGLYDKPIVILNIDGYYTPIVEMLNKAVKEQFMKEEHAMLWTVADTPEEAVKALLTEQEKHTL